MSPVSTLAWVEIGVAPLLHVSDTAKQGNGMEGNLSCTPVVSLVPRWPGWKFGVAPLSHVSDMAKLGNRPEGNLSCTPVVSLFPCTVAWVEILSCTPVMCARQTSEKIAWREI
jgi:hypothetical protein